MNKCVCGITNFVSTKELDARRQGRKDVSIHTSTDPHGVCDFVGKIFPSYGDLRQNNYFFLSVTDCEKFENRKFDVNFVCDVCKALLRSPMGHDGWRSGDVKIWRSGNLEIWKSGDLEIW